MTKHQPLNRTARIFAFVFPQQKTAIQHAAKVLDQSVSELLTDAVVQYTEGKTDRYGNSIAVPSYFALLRAYYNIDPDPPPQV